MSQKKQNAGALKKAIWIALPIIIIAIVVVAVYIGQSASLSSQVDKLKADKEAMSQNMDMAVNTERELADTQISTITEQLEAAEAKAEAAEAKAQEAETKAQEAGAIAQQAEEKVQAAEAKAQEAADKTQAAEAKAQEAEQKTQAAEAKAQEAETKAQEAEIKVQEAEAKASAAENQAQEAQDALDKQVAALQQAQADKDKMEDGIKQVQAALSLLVPNDTYAQLQEALTALDAMTAERDVLQSALIDLTNEKNDWMDAAENAKIESARAIITDADGNTVLEVEDANALNLADLAAGDYTVTTVIYNAAGEEAARYSFPYAAR